MRRIFFSWLVASALFISAQQAPITASGLNLAKRVAVSTNKLNVKQPAKSLNKSTGNQNRPGKVMLCSFSPPLKSRDEV